MTRTDHATAYLDREHVSYERLPHRHTESASQEAAALGVTPDEVAKTIIVMTERHGFIRAVLPASERLDLHKLRLVLGLPDEVRLATEAELAIAYPQFELGAVPPIGGPAGNRIVIDRRLAEQEEVVIEAGSHDESVRLKTTDLVITSMAMIGDISHD